MIQYIIPYIALIGAIYISYKFGRVIQAYRMELMVKELNDLVLCPECMNRFKKHIEKIKCIQMKILP